jgi:hypothetical protein
MLSSSCTIAGFILYMTTVFSWSVFFLPSAFLLLSGSEFQATPHDDGHDAFMTLPPYTRTREDEARQQSISLSEEKYMCNLTHS